MGSHPNGLTNGEDGTKLKVVVVGAGLGGLACAISCAREGLDVVVLEKSKELSEIGAGIQLPPNASRIMSDWGLMDKIREAGGTVKRDNYILRWQDGTNFGVRPGLDWAKSKFGHGWHTMHRADYQRVLATEASRLGAVIRFNCEVMNVEAQDDQPSVTLSNGEVIKTDVLVGADGLWSQVRTAVLGYIKEPEESGDFAYRVTIPRELLENEPDPFISGIVNTGVNATWWGPNSHVVLYSVRGEEIANLVLVQPDDLPPEVSRQPGDLAQMHKIFENWDPRLRLLIGKVNKALKWKIWVKGSIALLGDACHPSVPYAASGAAMAVEDGATLGRLLGLFSKNHSPRTSLPSIMQLYEQVRKDRAEATVRTANSNRELYHMVDGPKQQERDRLFREHDWWDEQASFPYLFGDLGYLHQLFGFDTLRTADEAFEKSRFGRNTDAITSR